MDKEQLEYLKAGLYSQIWLTGGWHRRRAVKSLVRDGSSEAMRLLAEAVTHSENAQVVKLALKWLRQLAPDNPEAQEALCRLVIDYDHPDARKIVLANNYTPRDSYQRSLFYFLTEQWEQYEQLDVEQNLLKTVYPLTTLDIRKRLAECARRAGRLEWIQVVAGEHQRKQLSKMTDEEWEVTLTLLSERKAWQEMWRLAQIAPAVWSVRLLLRVKEATWMPEHEMEHAVFTELARKAEKCKEEAISELGKLVQCYAVLKMSVICLAFSPDGQLVASGSEDGSVQLWSLPDGEALQTLKGHTARANSIAFSPDGQLVASGSEDGTVRLWRLLDGMMLKMLKAYNYGVECITISSDGRLLACGGGDRYEGFVRVWSLPDGALLGKRDEDWIGPSCLASSPDGRLLAAQYPYNIKLMSLPDSTLLRELEGYTDDFTWVNSLAINSDGRLLIGGDGHTVRLWSLPDGILLKILEGHTDNVKDIVLGFDERLLVSGSRDHTVRLWNMPDGTLVRTLEGHTDTVNCTTISPDGRLLVSGSADHTVRLWDMKPYRLIHVPIEQINQDDMSWLQGVLPNEKNNEAEWYWLDFVYTLMCWHRKHDIEVTEAPTGIPDGESDIEIEK